MYIRRYPQSLLVEAFRLWACEINFVAYTCSVVVYTHYIDNAKLGYIYILTD